MYKISTADKPLADEFKADPIGHHSPELQRILNLFRGEPMKDKYVLVCTKPYEEWVLGQLAGERGVSVKILKDQVFNSVEEAEWHVFKLRWEKHTGEKLAD